MAIRAIARINARKSRITFQRHTSSFDEYRNAIDVWEDYFTCSAYSDDRQTQETDGAEPHENRLIVFNVRFCPECAQVMADGYRIVFQNQVYDILSVDTMNFQNKTMKFYSRLQIRENPEG